MPAASKVKMGGNGKKKKKSKQEHIRNQEISRCSCITHKCNTKQKCNKRQPEM